MIGIGFAAGMTPAAKALRIVSFLFVIMLMLLASYCQGRTDGKNKAELANQKAVNAQIERARKEGEKAAEARLADERRQLEAEKQYEAAIAAAPGGRNSPASVALACQRLRRAGYAGSDLPAECGR
jgi:uncharacterized membrane protein YhiD involved in acid resistance